MSLMDKAREKAEKRKKADAAEKRKQKREQRRKDKKIKDLTEMIAAVFMTVESEGEGFKSHTNRADKVARLFKDNEWIMDAWPVIKNVRYRDADAGDAWVESTFVEYKTFEDKQGMMASLMPGHISSCSPENFENTVIHTISKVL